MNEWLIALLSTLSGTLLGWLLQFIKKKKLIFSQIIIRPHQTRGGICNAFFKLNVYNTSQYTRAIRDPIVICFNKGKEIFKEQIQETKLYISQEEREESEKYRSDIELIEIPPHGNISKLCKIELFDVFDLNSDIDKVYINYKDEKFKQRTIKVLWQNYEKHANVKEKNNGKNRDV